MDLISLCTFLFFYFQIQEVDNALFNAFHSNKLKFLEVTVLLGVTFNYLKKSFI